MNGGPTRRNGPTSRALQAVIGAVLLVGLLTRNVSVFVNATVALAVTFLPGILERDYRLHLHPRLATWLTFAVTLHAVGMVGLYDRVWWWDHVTHLLSAALVTGVAYATLRAVDEHTPDLFLSPWFMSAVLLVFTLAFGVLWEVLEFAGRRAALLLGTRPILVQYGLDDTLLDLVFDALGAVVVIALRRHIREFRTTAEALGARLAGR